MYLFVLTYISHEEALCMNKNVVKYKNQHTSKYNPHTK